MKKPKVLIACGGSGGHIFPGIALAEALLRKNRDCGIFIVTSDRRIDTEIFGNEAYPYTALPYNRTPRNFNPFKIIRFLVKLLAAAFKSIRILKKEKCDCVVGLGGYVSGPVVFAAFLMRKPILVHEQNVLPSLTNRLSAYFTDTVCISFDKTKEYFKNKRLPLTGNPIRFRYLEEDTDSSYRELGFNKNKFTVLVMGGSQGSSFLNNSFKNAVYEMNDSMKERLQILHITGKKDYTQIKDEYRSHGVNAKVYPFLERIGYGYNIADLVVSRAGATALAEITAFGRPSILIPYPEKRIHQKENAEYLSGHDAAVSIEEKDLDPKDLKNTISSLINDSKRLNQMACNAKSLSDPDAAYKLADEVLNVIR